MTPQQFRDIRLSLGLSTQKMAEFLGLKSGRMVRYYQSGQKPIPERIEKFLEAKKALREVTTKGE